MNESDPFAPECLTSKTSFREIDTKNAIMRGFAVITKGEALGHALWIDDLFLDQIVSAGNSSENGAKARLTHPFLDDGLFTFIGRARDFTRDGDVVRADLHLSESARISPKFEKDPVEYILSLAKEDPTAFGASIVFSHDYDAEDEFENNNKHGRDFKSPDHGNVNNYTHARLAELRAVDLVDEPAANPSGIFSKRVFAASAAAHEEEKEMEKKELDAAQELAAKAERERFASLQEAFPDDVAFAAKMFSENKTVEQASAEYIGVMREKLAAANQAQGEALAAKNAELADLVEKLNALEAELASAKTQNNEIGNALLSGASPVPSGGDGENETVFEKALRIAKEEKIPYDQAVKMAMK